MTNLETALENKRDEMAEKSIHRNMFLDLREADDRVRSYKAAYNELLPWVIKLAEALDVATDLLSTPEHMQDDEWCAKQKECNEALADFREWAK